MSTQSYFKVTVNLVEDPTKYPTFKEALRAMFTKVKQEMDQDNLSHQGLWECTWIENLGPEKEFIGVLDFAAARDYGYELGIVVNGQVVQ